MAWWVYALQLAAMFVIGNLMAPRMRTPDEGARAGLEDIRAPTASADRLIPEFMGEGWIRGPNLVWYGDLVGEPQIERVVVGVTWYGRRRRRNVVRSIKWFLSIQYDLGFGPFDAVLAIERDGELVWEGEVTENQTVEAMDGAVDIMMGAPDQQPNPYLVSQHGGADTAYRGTVTALLRRVFIGETAPDQAPSLRPVAFRVRRIMTAEGGVTGWNPDHAVAGVGMNAAHIIRERLTSRRSGLAAAAHQVDEESFAAAAETLYDEGFGLTFQWTGESSVYDFAEEVANHVDAVVHVHPRTGRWRMKLARDDYDPEQLFVLHPGNFTVDEWARPGMADLVNQVTVIYTDPHDGSDRPVTAQDMALIQAQGGIVARTLRYPGIRDHDLANRVAWRDLRQLSAPLARVSGTGNRSTSHLLEGDVVRIDWPDAHTTGLICRVTRSNHGELQDGRIELSLVEDVFAAGEALYATPPATEWTPPPVEPLPVETRRLIEVPHYVLQTEEVLDADPDNLDPEAAWVAALALAPSGASLGYALQARVEGGTFDEFSSGAFTPTAVLSADVGRGDEVLPIQEGVALDAFELGDPALLGDEIVRIDDVSASSISVGRGCADTLPQRHDAGTRIWLLPRGTYAGAFPSEATIDGRLITEAPGGELPPGEAPIDQLVLGQRHQRPYPPGNLRINGAPWPASIPGEDFLALQWAHRDRTIQTAELTPHSAGNIGPEAGTVYNVSIYGEDDELLGQALGIEATSFIFSDESEGTPWTPAEIDTALWLDASDADTLEIDDTDVIEWRDKSGNERDYDHTTSSEWPQFAPESFGGNDAVQWTGGNMILRLGSSNLLQNVGQAIFFMAIKLDAVPGSNITAFSIATNNVNQARFDVRSDAGGKYAIGGRRLDSNSFQLVSSTTDIDTSPRVLGAAIDYSAANMKLSLDGEVEADVAFQSAGTTTNLSSARSSIGQYLSQTAAAIEGRIGEIVIVHGDASVQTRQLIEGYLAHKWGTDDALPSEHPYKSAPPQVGAGGLAGWYRVELETERDGYVSSQRHSVEVRRHGYGYSYGMFYGGGA